MAKENINLLIVDDEEQFLESIARSLEMRDFHVTTVNRGDKAIEVARQQEIDIALVMTVHPGFSGQSFIEAMLPKIEAVRRMVERMGAEAHVQIDGGVDPSNIRQAYSAGADVFVAASAIYKHPDGIEAGVESLRQAISL